MLREIRPAIVVLVALTLITGLAYPLAITGIAGVIFPRQAQGSLIEQNGTVVGSALIGQVFASDKYFHGRPSATTATDPNDSTKTVPAPYNAANSGGSNLGPSNKALIDRVQGDIDTLKKENPNAPVPQDLVFLFQGDDVALHAVDQRLVGRPEIRAARISRVVRRRHGLGRIVGIGRGRRRRPAVEILVVGEHLA